jgi:hypothetical protein
MRIWKKYSCPLWNERFRCPARLAGDAHRAVPKAMNLDSILSIWESRTVAQDYTVRWQGVIYRMERDQVRPSMRGARVQLEQRRDGSRWMQWRNRMVALQPCETTARRLAEPPTKTSVAQRSTKEKVRARQRLLEARRQWSENFRYGHPRPTWPAELDSPLHTAALR